MQKQNGPKNGSGWLLRTRATLPSRVFSSFGADPERHVSSIQISQEDMPKGRSVLMFHDFIASGSTAAGVPGDSAGRRRQAGARAVPGKGDMIR